MLTNIRTAQRSPALWRGASRALSVGEVIAYGAAAIGMLLLMLLTVADVVMRTTVDKRITGAIEFTEVLLVIVAFSGMAVAARDRQHIRATLLTDRLRPAAAHHVRRIGSVVAVAVLVWMIYGATLRASTSVEHMEMKLGLIDIPVWPARVAIPIGLALLALVMISEIVRSFRQPDVFDDDGPQGGSI